MLFDRTKPSQANNYQAAHAALIARNYAQLTKKELLTGEGNPTEFAQALYEAPFAVLAHDGAPDPIFFYANLTAQKLFNLPWENFVALPSRMSAEPGVQEERQALLDRVERDGFIDDYSGVRIASDGSRFKIDGATVWNLYDEEGTRIGQAATFDQWTAL